MGVFLQIPLWKQAVIKAFHNVKDINKWKGIGCFPIKVCEGPLRPTGYGSSWTIYVGIEWLKSEFDR